MTDAETKFELVDFEQVEAAPGTALLRVAGRPASELPAGELTLVIDIDGTEHRHEQLPALPGPPGQVRAAFSTPLDHVSAGASYALELPDGQLVTLPPPSPGAGAANVAPAATAATPGSDGDRAASEGTPADSSRLVDAERQAETDRVAIADLERRLHSERERRTAAESELAHLRGERDEARGERDTALSDRDEAVADRDQAEARARSAAATAGATEAQMRAAGDAATRAQTALEAQLADRSAELERIRSAAEVAQARAHASRREVTALDEQLAHAQAQVTVLQQALDEREAEHLASASAADDEIGAARAETVNLRERMASLEALRHRNTELEATLADLDAALARRGAEIELLRDALGGDGDAGARLAEVRSEASSVLVAEVDLLRAQVQEHREKSEQTERALQAALARADAAEASVREQS